MSKILYLMRGLPGSGKSFLAKKTIEEGQKNNLNCVICSADQFFTKDGIYTFDMSKLGMAHAKCRENSRYALEVGFDLVIVDNTNVSQKECDPYVKMGLEHGYTIRFLSPQIYWANDLEELLERNIHDVPRSSYERMMKNWMDTDLIGISLAAKYSATYDAVEKSIK